MNISVGTKVRIVVPNSWASDKTGVCTFIAEGNPEWPYAIEIEDTGMTICFKESEMEVINQTQTPISSGSGVSSPGTPSVCASNERKAGA